MVVYCGSEKCELFELGLGWPAGIGWTQPLSSTRRSSSHNANRIAACRRFHTKLEGRRKSYEYENLIVG
jgi:hypothetical protein